MARICKYGCGTMLEGFDEDKRRYIEYGTIDCLHTVERCKEAKAKRQEKNDHGNEQYDPKKVYIEGQPPGVAKVAELPKSEYVDHTLKGASKVKIFVNDFAPNVEADYNDFLAKNKVKTQGAQFQFDGDAFAIALYYEEVK